MGKLNIKLLQRLYFKHAISSNTYWIMKKVIRRRNHRVRYIPQTFQLSVYSKDECLLYFRFSMEEIEYLIESLHIPRVIRLQNRIKFSGQEGVCLVLRRLSYPNRLSDVVSMFKRDEGTLSRIFNFTIKWIYAKHAHQLHSLQQNFLTRLHLQHLAKCSFESGCPYANIVGFIDCTCRPICRPKYNQRNQYSGYRKCHVVKYQSIMLTNGIIGRLDGPFNGHRHDKAIVDLSGVLHEMRTFLSNNDGSYFAVYGDLVYCNQKFIKSGFKNYGNLSQAQKQFNESMSALRLSVEYGFGSIIQEFAFLDFKKSQKLYLNPIKELFYVAAFFINCQTCIRGRNRISDIFNSVAPTLEDYLS